MRRSLFSAIRFLGAVALLGLSARAQDGGERATGRLAGGRVIEAVIHRPVNALAAAVRSGDSIVAATPVGGLLRFDGPNQRLTRERWDLDSPAACLGRGEGEAAYAGLADGRICRIDTEKLTLTEVARLAKEPIWIGWSSAAGDGKGGLVVATGDAVVHDLSTGRTIEAKDKIWTCLVDRDGRLWIGGDKGEWGGRVARVDLRTGVVVEVPPPPRPPREGFAKVEPFWEGVYGFVELRDGQVWAFGGSMHMGINAASLVRVDELMPRPLFNYDQADNGGKPPTGPSAPITHIIEDGDGLLVLSYSDVFRVDRSLKNWKAADAMSLRYKWGRPDAVGAYPAVQALLAPSRAGEPIVAATAGEGLIALDGGKTAPRSSAGRLGASEVHRIENSAEGLLFIEDDEYPAWTLGPNGWKILDLAPPFQVDPDSDAPQFERDLKAWADTRVLVGSNGTIYTVSRSGIYPGTVATARREGGKSILLGLETSSVGGAGTFLTPDGTLWEMSDWLWRFSNGRWKRVAPRSEFRDPYQPFGLIGKGPPWLLVDRGDDWSSAHPWRLVPDGPIVSWLTEIDLFEKGARLWGGAALPWNDGLVLFATSGGLRTYDVATGRLGRVDFPDAPEPKMVRALARDGRGRVWLGGDKGLYLTVPGARSVEAFDAIPEFRGAEVLALAPDPARADGVVASLGAKGVAFVRAIEP